MWVSGLESNLDCVLTIIYMILVRVNGGSRVCSRNSGCVAGIHLNEWFSCPQTEVIIQLSNLLSVLSSNNVYIRYPDQWIAREWILYWLKSPKNVLLLKPNQWLSKWLLFFFYLNHSNNLKKQNLEIHMKTKSHILYKNLSFLHK